MLFGAFLRSLCRWAFIFFGAVVPCVSVAQSQVPGRYFECPGVLTDTVSGRSGSFSDFAERFAKTGIVVFGERHGNRNDVVASACILSVLDEGGAGAALVMEILATSDQGVIESWRRDHPERAAGLGVALRWWERSWPTFDGWLPLLDRAFALRVPIIGADLAADNDMTEQSSLADAPLRARYGSAFSEVFASWKGAMHSEHCGLLGESELERRALDQLRRDASFADAALSMAADRNVLLHVGRSHARRDRGLLAILPSGSKDAVLSVGAFSDGEQPEVSERRQWDFIWTTGSSPAQRDSCAFFGKTPKAEMETTP